MKTNPIVLSFVLISRIASLTGQATESTKEKIKPLGLARDKALEKTPESMFAIFGGEKQLIPIRQAHRDSNRFFADDQYANTDSGRCFFQGRLECPLPLIAIIGINNNKTFISGAEKSVTASEIGKLGSTMLLTMNMDENVEGSYAVV